jgi:uncharacterized protein (DUF4415 family)
MKNSHEFPFHEARRLTPSEVEKHRKAIEHATGKPRRPRGRPAKHPTERYAPVSIRLHPRAVKWAKQVARQKGVGYQTVINEALLHNVAREEQAPYSHSKAIASIDKRRTKRS